MRSAKTQSGLSLIELMIAILIGAIVIAAVIQIFLGVRETYQVQEAKSRMQENGRFAVQILSRNLMEAGYYGCATRTGIIANNTLNNSNDYRWDFTTGIEGLEATGPDTWSPALDSSITSPLSGSDILTVRGSQEPTYLVSAHGGGDIQIETNNGLDNGDIVMVTDCENAAVFQITSANPDGSGILSNGTGSGSPGNSISTLGRDYVGGWVNPVASTSYYIRDPNRGGPPSLYRRISGNNAEELVEGVEAMQVLYGEDTNADGSADTYRNANAVVDWQAVVSVQFELLLVSLEDNLTVDGPQLYNFNGNTDINPNDGRLRSVFSRTVTLRNRVP